MSESMRGIFTENSQHSNQTQEMREAVGKIESLGNLENIATIVLEEEVK